MSEATEELGCAIDRLDSAAHGLMMNLPASFHLTQLKMLLPEIVRDLKRSFVQVTKTNPWEDEP